MRLRAWAEVTDHITVNDPRVVDGLSPYYVWTPDYAEKRLNWKRRHPLHVLLLRVHRIPRPVTVRVREEYHGCRSWVEVDRELPFEGTPVMADEEFDRARLRFLGSVAQQSPHWSKAGRPSRSRTQGAWRALHASERGRGYAPDGRP